MKLIFRYLGQAIRNFPKCFCVSMGLILALTIMETFVPWGLRQYLEQIEEQNNYGTIALGIGFFALYLIVKVFVKIIWYVSLDHFGGKYIELLTLSAERAMSEASYYDIERLGPGVVRNILYTDIFNVFRVIGHTAPAMLGAVAVILAALAISFVYEPRMTILILFATAFGILLSWCSRKILSKTAGKTNAKMKVHDAWCTQFVEMLPVIQSNHILPYYQEKTSENLQEFISTAISEDKHTIFWSELISGYHTLFSIALSALLAIPLAGNSIANLMFFTMIANLIMEQSQVLEMQFQQLSKSHVSFSHVDTLQNLPKRQIGNVERPISSVEFHDVGFSYPNGTQALHSITCKLHKGDFIRLSGPNGSGKTSFIKILTGLYPPKTGAVLFDGIPLAQYTQEKLNQHILYVGQDERCLNETFQKYLAVISGRPLSDEEFLEMLHRVQLPADSRVICENGNSLSVGQRKKLLVLKMMLKVKDSSILILDELTAGLDAETTRQVFALVQKLAASKDKIILFVDHNCNQDLHFTCEFHFENGELRIS